MSAIFDRALDRVGSDPDRWRTVLDSLRVLDASQRERMLVSLETVAQSLAPSGARTALWETVRDFTYKHRRFRTAHWALNGDLLDRLDAILLRLAPIDPIERSRWLFNEWLPDLPYDEDNIELLREQADDLRKHAVHEILQAHGVEGLVRLGTLCKFPGFVASTAVHLMNDASTARDFMEQSIAAGEAGISLAAQISGQAHQLHGEDWRAAIREVATAEIWSPEIIASLLIGWPDEPATWEDAATLNVPREYWRQKPVFVIGGTEQEQRYQIDWLIEVGRATHAFESVTHHSEGIPTEILVRLFDATFHELAQAEVHEARRLGIGSHAIREFLDELRKRTDLPREEMARREYQALPLLGWPTAHGLTIHEFMAEDPDFFVDVLCDVFLPAHREKGADGETSPEQQARAQAAYRLLEGMDRIPGQREGNRIDLESLLQWVNAVRKRAAEVDRATVADLKIGEILAHTAEDPEDGGWPHRTVRTVIEQLAADDVDRGLMTERFNMRGVYTKDVFEGGSQERSLAQRYRRWASISGVHWPRTARVLEKIAEGYEDHARREDIEAEQKKLE